MLGVLTIPWSDCRGQYCTLLCESCRIEVGTNDLIQQQVGTNAADMTEV